MSAPGATESATSPNAIATLTLVSLNVGKPSVIGERLGEPVLSGITKSPVGDSSLIVTTTNLEGDGQADLRAHGGPDKAIYAYPSEHLPAWSDRTRRGTRTRSVRRESDHGRTDRARCLHRRPLGMGHRRAPGLPTSLPLLQARDSSWPPGHHRPLPRFREVRLVPPRPPTGHTHLAQDAITVTDRLSDPVSVHTASRAILAGQATVAELESLIGLVPWRKAGDGDSKSA